MSHTGSLAGGSGKGLLPVAVRDGEETLAGAARK